MTHGPTIRNLGSASRRLDGVSKQTRLVVLELELQQHKPLLNKLAEVFTF